MKLADTSIQRPVFAVMLIGGLVVLGSVAVPRLGLDLFPRVEFPCVTVTTVLEAGPIRMRPVLMTAVSTIFGMLPVVLSSGDGSEWRPPDGRRRPRRVAYIDVMDPARPTDRIYVDRRRGEDRCEMARIPAT